MSVQLRVIRAQSGERRTGVALMRMGDALFKSWQLTEHI